jgi:hypothetical protein
MCTWIREESKGLVWPLLTPFSGTCLNSPSAVHNISIFLKLYSFDITLLPHISTRLCIACFTIRLTYPVRRILDVALQAILWDMEPYLQKWKRWQSVSATHVCCQFMYKISKLEGRKRKETLTLARNRISVAQPVSNHFLTKLSKLTVTNVYRVFCVCRQRLYSALKYATVAYP